MGSVKDLTVIKAPTPDELGIGKFAFSDRYSVFDWGEMPDHIPSKGKSLAMMAAYNFIQLASRGIRSHFISLYSAEDGGKSGFDPARPSGEMYVTLTRVLPIENDYAAFGGDHPHYLIPLEIIFRNGAPKGSSLFKKLEKARGNETEHEAFLQSMNLESEPEPGDFFPEPVYDFTTKLESTDRPVAYSEAQQMAGLNDSAFLQLIDLVKNVNTFVTDRAAQVGMQHYDGKIEAMYNHGQVELIDVLGTFDENRFLFDGEQVSKEILRQAYKVLQPDWVTDTEQAKQEAAEQGDDDWKAYCPSAPKPLPDDLVRLVSHIYQAGANRYIGKPVFKDVEPLEELMPRLRSQKQKLSD